MHIFTSEYTFSAFFSC